MFGRGLAARVQNSRAACEGAFSLTFVYSPQSQCPARTLHFYLLFAPKIEFSSILAVSSRSGLAFCFTQPKVPLIEGRNAFVTVWLWKGRGKEQLETEESN